MSRLSRKFILGISILVVFALVWQKLQIWVRIDLSLWQALLMFAVIVVGLFLFLDHFINGSR